MKEISSKILKEKRNLFILLLLIIILGELVWAHFYLSKPLPVIQAPTPPEASLSLSPSSGTFATDGVFEVQVILEAEDTVSTDGVDTQIFFDPTKVEVVEVAEGTLYPQYLLNTFDNEGGMVRLAAANLPDQTEITGGGVLGTITFKALTAGETEVGFVFLEKGETRDSNVAGHRLGGQDILTQVTNGKYTIE